MNHEHRSVSEDGIPSSDWEDTPEPIASWIEAHVPVRADEEDFGSGPEGQARRASYLATSGFTEIERGVSRPATDPLSAMREAEARLDARLDAYRQAVRLCSRAPLPRPRARARRPARRARRTPRATRAGPKGADDPDPPGVLSADGRRRLTEGRRP